MTDSPAEPADNPKVTIDWYRSTPWWRLASQSVVISWRASHLIMCAAALLITQLWVSLSHYLFTPESSASTVWIAPGGGTNPIAPQWSSDMPDSVLSVWQHYLSPVLEWLQAPTLNGAADCLASMIGIIAIWSFVGGCLARRSVVELGTRMTAPWAETFRIVRRRWQSIAWSVAMPSGLILMIAVGPLMLGWVSNIPAIGLWIAGLLMIPTLFLSVGIGWCGAITVFGFPLSVCSIVTEKQADAYDGISRSAAYTFQRPLTLALCVVALQGLGLAGGCIVSLVLTTGYAVIEAGFNVGSFSSLEQIETIWSPILKGILPLLIAAFGFSFFWTAASATYLILRKDVDHAEFDVIDMDVPEEPKALPELPKKESNIPAELTENSAE
jgi:hypothetical protein